jgi:hypothetical protein
VDLNIANRASDSTIGRTLKKKHSQAGSERTMGHPEGQRRIVYTRPSNPDYPLVCLDENSKPMIAENARAHPREKRATRVI